MPRPRGKRRPFRQPDPFAKIRKNHRIRVPKIRVVGPSGEQVGVMNTKEALTIALDAGLDLVEVAPAARPPVCRIMDFGKYVYEQQKKNKDQKTKASTNKVKEVKFRVRIEQHDFDFKIRHAEEFLHKGNKVKLTLFFRGREMAHKDLGFVIVDRAVKALEHMATQDSPSRLVGRNVSTMLSPLPANKRKPKFLHHKEADSEARKAAENEMSKDEEVEADSGEEEVENAEQ